MCKFSIQIEPVAATMASDILQASCHYRKFGRCLECCLWQRLSAVICRIEPLWLSHRDNETSYSWSKRAES